MSADIVDEAFSESSLYGLLSGIYLLFVAHYF